MLLEMALCVIPVNNSWSVHRLWSGDIRGGKPWAGFAQGFCLSKQLHAIPPVCVLWSSEGTVPCTREVRAGMQTTAATPQDAANPKVLCSSKAGASAGR